MQYKKIRIHLNPILSILELVIIIHILKMMPSITHLGFTFIEYFILSVLIFIGSLGALFIHECGHVIAACCIGLPIRAITITLSGAYTSLACEPSTAKESFVIASAGPLMNIAAGIIFYGGYFTFYTSDILRAFCFCISCFNGVLVIYNLLPVMPLDGGFIIRSIFWNFGSNFMQSSKISFGIGNAVISLFFLAGFIGIFNFHPITSVLCFILGFSLWQGAKTTYQRFETARVLSMLSNYQKRKEVIRNAVW